MSKAPRWRVAIVDDHERSRAALRAAIWAAGGEVAGEAMRRGDAKLLVERTKADVAIFAVGLPDGDGIDAAADIAGGCPVVLFTSRSDDSLVERARAAGVMAYLLKPLRPAELAPALDLAVARFGEVRALRARLDERKVIERAKGAIMRRYGLSEEDAFQRLRRAAMDSRRSMAEIARALLVSESVTGDVPAK
ncbi:MAG: response regulator [Candidatus Rokuibacteriota bacterium]|nr:MAG: response regulator [Candidatus Rokubacteria bacterium]